MNHKFFVADEGDGMYNVFAYADFNGNGYYDGHDGEEGYHINDFDKVFQCNHFKDAVALVDRHES